MTTQIRKLYKGMKSRFPVIGNLIEKIRYHRFHLNNVKRKISGHGNAISHRHAQLTSVTFDIKGNHNQIVIKEGCVLNNVTFYIRGNDHQILIDKHCLFNRGGNLWCEDSNCSLTIGENSTFEDVHLALTEPGSRISIGRDCMFAYDIDVRTGDSHSIISRESNERINYAEDVFIGDHVWIAAHSILLKGTHISDNSVVGTGSIVSRRFDTEGVVLAGNPARQVKEGITWSRQRTYK